MIEKVIEMIGGPRDGLYIPESCKVFETLFVYSKNGIKITSSYHYDEEKNAYIHSSLVAET